MRPIVSRRIRLQSTKFVGLEEFVALSQANTQAEYTVAWIDCVAQGRNFARGIFMQGEHDENSGSTDALAKPKVDAAFRPAGLCPQPLFRGRLQHLYYHKQMGKQRDCAGRLRAFSILWTASSVESALWQAGSAPVPMRSAVGERSDGHDPGVEGDHRIGAGFLSCRHQGLRGCGFSRMMSFPCLASPWRWIFPSARR